MKMKSCILYTFILFCFGTQAQMMRGNFSIDPYIGVPNWANSLLYNQAEDSSWNDYNSKGGPLSYGGRIEYMVSDQIGIGVDVNYEVSGYEFTKEDYAYDANGQVIYDINNNPVYDNYTQVYTAKKLRGMFRLNYHFLQEDKIDMYVGFAGGYKNVNRSWDSTPNDPNFADLNSDISIPVTMRMAVGAKMYFTENIGAHVELGAFGGGLLQFGVSVKF